MKMASDKQKYVCGWIYNYINHEGAVLNLYHDSRNFAASLTAKEAWDYIQANENIYLKLKDVWEEKKQIRRIPIHTRQDENLSVYDNAFTVTDWSDCYDYGICPWGDS